MSDVWRTDGRCELRGGAGKIVDVVSPGRPQSFRYQRQSVDDYSLGREGMAQDGRTRGGMFRGEINRCRESQVWTTVRSSISERDGKDQREDSQREHARVGSLPIVD